MRINHAVIMAAGRGQRMLPLTESIPKPMAPYLNSTLVADGIARLRRYIPNVHVTVGYKGAMLAQHLIEHDVNSILNTNGRPNSWWIHNTLFQHVDEPIFVLTCDNITELDFSRLEVDYFDLSQPAAMLVAVKPIDGLEGDFILHEGRRVVRVSRSERSDIYCSGIQVLNPHRVSELTTEGGDFYSIWNQLIAVSELKVSSIYPSRWFTVDTMADLDRLSQEYADADRPRPPSAG